MPILQPQQEKLLCESKANQKRFCSGAILNGQVDFNWANRDNFSLRSSTILCKSINVLDVSLEFSLWFLCWRNVEFNFVFSNGFPNGLLDSVHKICFTHRGNGISFYLTLHASCLDSVFLGGEVLKNDYSNEAYFMNDVRMSVRYDLSIEWKLIFDN